MTLSAEARKRITGVLARHIEAGPVPGLVALVSRRGDVHVEAMGVTDLERRVPMQRDTLFRISSMTKPIAAVATLMLIEDGRVGLDEPLDALLPELANRRVLKRLEAPIDETVPANRPITVRDLLTFRMGFGLLMAAPDAFPILRAARDLNVGLGPPNPARMPEPDEWLRRLGTLPLMRQPGETWLYHTGSQVLSVLVARASGRSFETFLRERLFEPLGMKDTSFQVPREKLARFATSYCIDPDTGATNIYDPADGGQWSQPPAFQSGADGLVSTVDDYLAFAAMLSNRGVAGRERLLSPSSVDAMTTEQLTESQRADGAAFLDGRGWGFGVAVRKQGNVTAASSQYGWDGGLGTSWCSDPAKQLIGILLTQTMWMSPTAPALSTDFWRESEIEN